jgi:hypothetical protein
MGNVLKSGQTWPFFYSRNETVDYSFLILPEPLKGNQSTVQALQRLMRPAGTDALQHHELIANGRRYDVYYAFHEAKSNSNIVLDNVGRQVFAVWGILTDQTMDQERAVAAIERFEDFNRGLANLFWLGETRDPVISTGGAIELTLSRGQPPTGSTRQTESTQFRGPTRPPKFSVSAITMVGAIFLVLGFFLGAVILNGVDGKEIRGLRDQRDRLQTQLHKCQKPHGQAVCKT